MQEFGLYEQKIIIEKLLNGASLREMFSERFTEDSRLIIQIDTTDEHHIFSFYSDILSAAEAVEELINLVDLISTLEENRLVRKYFKAATSMSDFDVDETIEIGASKSEKQSKFILPSGLAQDIVLFLHKNIDKTFKATQKLRAVVANNFEPLEVRQHKQVVGLTRTANVIAFLSAGAAMAALIISLLPSTEGESTERALKSLEKVTNQLEQQVSKESIANELINKDVEYTRLRVDSLVNAAKPLKRKN